MSTEENIISPAIQQLITIIIAIATSSLLGWGIVRYIHKMKRQIEDLEKRYNDNPIIQAYERYRKIDDENIQKKFIEQNANIIGMYADKKQEKEDVKE